MERSALFIFLLFCGLSHVFCHGSYYQLMDDEGGNYIVVQTESAVFLQGSLAVAWYEKGINRTGWDYLDIKTNENVSDKKAAFAAGFLEGSITADLISDHYYNTMGEICEGHRDLCEEVEEMMVFNMASMPSKSDTEDEYWYQVSLVIEQLQGLMTGYSHALSNPMKQFNWHELLWLNYRNDIDDVVQKIQQGDNKPLSTGDIALSSALIKLVPGFNLYVAHDTSNTYQSMLRIQKHYNLPFRRGIGNPETIPGVKMTLSSYPGLLTSGDDFYQIASGLVTLATKIGNENPTLKHDSMLQPTLQVPEWIRSLVANRLATDGKSWSDIFKLHNSGTNNKQWMVVDYSKFDPLVKPSKLPDGLLWVTEHMQNLIVADDRTENLRKDTYFASSNVPFFTEILDRSESHEMAKKFGDWFTYEKNPRALIIKRDQGKVRNLQAMLNLMRYNDFQHDPLSRCNCDPPYSAVNSIAARGDLNPKDGRYPFPALGHSQRGVIDAKITSVDLFANNLSFLAVSGPVHSTASGIPPFQWSTSDFGNTTRHLGHPDMWNFKPVVYQWST